MSNAAPWTPEDLHRASRDLAGITQRTPVEFSQSISEIVGTEVWLKCENLQSGGSFKIRGAYTRMARLDPEQRAAGVIAASAGNHAQGVALAARRLGIPATVYMPEGAALPKVAATRSYGAHVRLAGETVDEALEAALAESERTGQVVIHPFDHRDIVLGQATLGLELMEQLPQAAQIIAPAGGGGLLAGIASAVRLCGTGDTQVIGAQAEGAAAFPASLTAGTPLPLERMNTMADGIAVGCPGEVPLEIIAQDVFGIMTVSEEEISQALLLLTERAKLVVEPAGAAGVAALLHGAGHWDGPVVAVLTGGNIDPLVLNRILQHGLAGAGRFLQIRFRVLDTPGHLARLLAAVAADGANVLSVGHSRTSATQAVDEVDITVEVETRGRDHAEQLLGRLREKYQLLTR